MWGGHGPLLLICHATGFCGLAYQRFAEHLAQHLHVWAVGLRGHGDLPPPADDYFAWAGMARDVRAAAEAIGAETLHVFGHSIGGAAALRAEADAPGLFATAYLYEPIIVAPERRAASTGGRSHPQVRARERSEDVRSQRHDHVRHGRTGVDPPVVAIGGEPTSLAQMAPGIVAALPRARLRVHEHLGHFGPLQAPATVAADLLAHALSDRR